MREVATWGRQVIFISMLGFAACSSAGTPKATRPPPAPRTTVALPTTTTTTTIPLYSFDDSVPPPKLVDTGTNYKKILQSLLDYGNWLASHRPDAALIANVAAPASSLEGAFRHDLTILRNTKQRLFEVRDGKNEIVLTARQRSVFTARVREHIVTHRVIDGSGHVTSERRPKSRTTTYRYVVVRTVAGWRLAEGSELDENVSL